MNVWMKQRLFIESRENNHSLHGSDSPCQWNTSIFRPPAIEHPLTDRHYT